ncbi:hypothetical protein DXG01_013154 [Tephrocybe rancida]|nr:hypothetical protein DXG01_013154 [Tephrocybe rancida]
MSSSKSTLVIAGLEVNIYSATPINAERKEAVVFFLLHGRYGSAAEIDPIARSLIEQTPQKARSLLIVTFDQRNHGKRLVDAGTARDVSLLIDFLPSFLYPDDQPHPIVEWGVAGISLGGHATWISLATDKRVTTGIPIIGCPDYSKLIAYRANQTGVELVGRYYPNSFKSLVATLDPAAIIERGSNPFRGKRILVLSGADDKLVPWTASEEFVTQNLDVGPTGVKKVSLYDGVGHECTEGMVLQSPAPPLTDENEKHYAGRPSMDAYGAFSEPALSVFAQGHA